MCGAIKCIIAIATAISSLVSSLQRKMDQLGVIRKIMIKISYGKRNLLKTCFLVALGRLSLLLVLNTQSFTG